jgi:hypothetical protein
VKPAGVIKVGFESDIVAVLTPPISVVLPAKPLIITVKTKANMFDHLSKAELFVTGILSPNLLFLLFTYKKFSIYIANDFGAQVEESKSLRL